MNRYSILKDEIKISPKLHLQKHGVQTYILLLGITDDECFHLHMGNKQTLSFTRFDIPDLFRLNLELFFCYQTISNSSTFANSNYFKSNGIKQRIHFFIVFYIYISIVINLIIQNW